MHKVKRTVLVRKSLEDITNVKLDTVFLGRRVSRRKVGRKRLDERVSLFDLSNPAAWSTADIDDLASVFREGLLDRSDDGTCEEVHHESVLVLQTVVLFAVGRQGIDALLFSLSKPSQDLDLPACWHDTDAFPSPGRDGDPLRPTRGRPRDRSW